MGDIGGAVDPRTALADYMADLSEERWCASWMPACEFVLWNEMVEGETEDARELKRLHDAAGGWIFWSTVHDDTSFLPTDLWLEHKQRLREYAAGVGVGAGAMFLEERFGAMPAGELVERSEW